MEGVEKCNNLPPGFRFHPTDEELIVYYLKNQAVSLPCPVSIIPEVDIYKFDPWQLPEKAEFGDREWYFFTPRERKYPNGVRPNRAAVSGYWKATGTDKSISSGNKNVGIKKALVFYKGRPPKGIKTEWIMHEYRLTDSPVTALKKHGSMRLDDWVLCRIYRKKQVARSSSTEYNEEGLHSPISMTTSTSTDTTSHDHQQHQYHHQQQQQQMYNFPRTFSLAHLLDLDYLGGPFSHLLNDNSTTPPPPPLDNNSNNRLMVTTSSSAGIFDDEKMQFGQGMQPPNYYQFDDFSRILENRQSNNSGVGRP